MTDIRKELNSFNMTVVPGQVAMSSPASMTVQLIGTSVETLLPTYPVKLVTGTGVVPLVELAVPGTDDIYGLVLFNAKYSSWAAEDYLQISTKGTIMHLTAGATLNRGARVGLNTSTLKLQAAEAGNAIGILLDEAVLNRVVRVQLDIPNDTQVTS